MEYVLYVWLDDLHLNGITRILELVKIENPFDNSFLLLLTRKVKNQKSGYFHEIIILVLVRKIFWCFSISPWFGLQIGCQEQEQHPIYD